MLEFSTPESCGVSSAVVKKYIECLNKRGMKMHSVLLARGNKIFSESYWAPFDCEFKHRMYSQTKSYVSIAIGLLIDDKKLKLSDRVSDFFPDKINTPLHEALKNQTVEQMLTMTTVGHVCWFDSENPDRVSIYFNRIGDLRSAGTVWSYDSTGSQVLCELCERLSGMRFFDFLNERIFKHIGAFESASILSTKNGASWGDSALLCTSRDMATFARFVMNGGSYNGKQLISKEYIDKATSKVVDNITTPHEGIFHHGYGYQIWRTEKNGFAFVGMGDQLTVCLPDYDLIFVCTADNQGSEYSRDYIISNFFDIIVDSIESDSICENESDYNELCALNSTLELYSLKAQPDSPLRESLNGAEFVCDENEMGFKKFSFHFKNAYEGELRYTNENGDLVLPFLVNANKFGKFPELGYSQEYGGLRTTDGSKYDCATSFAWLQDNKILIYVQIIDRYFGNTSLTFAFNGDNATLSFDKVAEDFLWNYKGMAKAKRVK